MRRATTAKVCLDLAKSARLTVPGVINHRLQSPFARTEHDLLLPKLVKGTILAPKPAGIWRMSVKRRVPIVGLFLQQKRRSEDRNILSTTDHPPVLWFVPEKRRPRY
jgi:hypothetical protein